MLPIALYRNIILGSRSSTPPANRKSPTSDQGTQAEPPSVPDTSKPPPSHHPPAQQQQQYRQQNDDRRRQPQQHRDRGWERKDMQERSYERRDHQDHRPVSASYARGRGNNRGKKESCNPDKFLLDIC